MPSPIVLPELTPEHQQQQQAKYYYGVDMYNPANLTAPLRGTPTSKLQYVIDQEGRRPAFVGRYINAAGNPYAVPTPKEIAFIHDHGASVLPVYRPSRDHVQTSGAEGRRWGREAWPTARQRPRRPGSPSRSRAGRSARWRPCAGRTNC